MLLYDEPNVTSLVFCAWGANSYTPGIFQFCGCVHCAVSLIVDGYGCVLKVTYSGMDMGVS